MDALQLAHRNAKLNGVSERAEFCKADIAEYMREARGQGRTWDLIILDPPKLAPNRKVSTARYVQASCRAGRRAAPHACRLHLSIKVCLAFNGVQFEGAFAVRPAYGPCSSTAQAAARGGSNLPRLQGACCALRECMSPCSRVLLRLPQHCP